MNRKERRKARAIAVGTVINTLTKVALFVNGEQALYWCVVPDGMTDEEAWGTQELHGPFQTDKEVAESQRVTLLGEQCEVTEGGMWDSAWNRPQ